mgnify:CR=1 FL=1
MSDQFSKTLIEHVCDYEDQIKAVFYLSLAVLVLMSLSLLVLESGTATYVVAVMDVAGLVVLAAFSGALLYRCR